MSRPVRIPGAKPEEWSGTARAELAGVVSPAGGDAKPLHLPSVIARHPTFLPPYLAWAKAIALHGVLGHRDNALLALRTALRCDSEFEWGVHAATAVARGDLDAEEIERIAAGPDAPGWSAREAALLRAVDDLHECHTVGEDTWVALAGAYDAAALMEIVFVVGHYTMLSMVANSVGAPPEPGWSPLPSRGG
jgi:4-carboxymuconolactone decarboxylase